MKHKTTFRVRLNRRGMFLVKYERYPVNGQAVKIRPLIRWSK